MPFPGPLAAHTLTIPFSRDSGAHGSLILLSSPEVTTTLFSRDYPPTTLPFSRDSGAPRSPSHCLLPVYPRVRLFPVPCSLRRMEDGGWRMEDGGLGEGPAHSSQQIYGIKKEKDGLGGVDTRLPHCLRRMRDSQHNYKLRKKR